MATDRITISAGGKDFVTSLSTLKSSGAGYFEALLGPTGSSMRKGRKRARADDDEPPRELFVDRDPDLFTDVLAFMRSGRIPAATRTDAARLEDLKDEAEFFAFDALAAACDEAVETLLAALEAAAPPQAVATFRAVNVICGERARPAHVDVPEGQVLFIASATLTGFGCEARRYRRSEEEEKEDKKVGSYFYYSASQDNPDFQLTVGPTGTNGAVLAHFALDLIHPDSNSGLQGDFRQDIRTVIGGGTNNRVTFIANGPEHCHWSCSCWVGHADAIPGLTQPPAAPPIRAVPRSHRGDDDSFMTMMLAASLARRRSAARTRLAATAAIAHLAARR